MSDSGIVEGTITEDIAIENGDILMDPIEVETIRSSSKPDISDHLPAVHVLEDGQHVPLFEVNDDIIIERYCSSLPNRPWLDTQTYTVKGIDDTTGNLRLWNSLLHQWALGNFITGPARGDLYVLIGKMAGKSSKKKVNSKSSSSLPVVGKRGRGRPKGSTNRPKSIVAEEKRAKAELIKVKKASKKRITVS